MATEITLIIPQGKASIRFELRQPWTSVQMVGSSVRVQGAEATDSTRVLTPLLIDGQSLMYLGIIRSPHTNGPVLLRGGDENGIDQSRTTYTLDMGGWPGRIVKPYELQGEKMITLRFA